MSTFAFVHGGGGSGWEWHLVAGHLRARGHQAVTPDLSDDESATLSDYADEVVRAVGDIDELIVVAHSFGAFTAPLVAARRPVRGLVLVAGMVPIPGEAPADWWTNTGHADAVREQATADAGLTGNDDAAVCYYHDVPASLATQALYRERSHPSMRAYTEPWPLDSWPDVPTRFVLCTEDRFLPAEFVRRVASDRLGITPDELVSGHCPALGHAHELASLLSSYRFPSAAVAAYPAS